MIKFRLEGLKKVEDVFEKVSQVYDVLAERTAKAIRDEAANLSPVRTGKLMASWNYVKISDGRYVVGSRMFYAPYLEFGTRPHVIRPKQARALRFEVDGEVVYARYVHHPGIKPMGFVRKAIKLVKDRFRSFASNIVRNVLRGE